MFLDGALTFATFALLGGMFWTCWKANDMVTLRELIAALLVSAFAIGNFKYFFGWVHSLTASDKALSKPRNQRKYGDQGWQLAIHVFATFYEFYLISTYSDWKWWTEIGTIFNKLDAPQKGALTTFYMVQLGIWFATAISHKFFEARHKDYFVMYSHHVVTLMLIIGSYLNDWLPVGLVVLLIHDSSDILVDACKMANYAGADGAKHLFATEILFLSTVVGWFYTRIYLLPSKIILATMPEDWSFTDWFGWTHVGTMPLHEANLTAAWCCRFLLVILTLMHIWWWMLMIRIVVKLASEDADKLAEKEYEGDDRERGSSEDSEPDDTETDCSNSQASSAAAPSVSLKRD